MIYVLTHNIFYDDDNNKEESLTLQSIHDHIKWISDWYFSDSTTHENMYIESFTKYSYTAFCLKKEDETVNDFEKSMEIDGKIYVRKYFFISLD